MSRACVHLPTRFKVKPAAYQARPSPAQHSLLLYLCDNRCLSQVMHVCTWSRIFLGHDGRPPGTAFSCTLGLRKGQACAIHTGR